VVAVAVGGTSWLRLTAGPPAPPAGTPVPSSPAPEPSPRPAPLAVEPVDDPIAEIDWGTATINVPPRDGCPSGAVTFVAREDFPIVPDEAVGWAYAPLLGPPEGFPAIGIEFTDSFAVGDLTGDGHAEAVLAATCHPDEDGGGYGETLMVVAHDGSWALNVLGWINVPAGHQGIWITDGQLFVQPPQDSSGTDAAAAAPGLVLTYRWDSGEFVGGEPAGRYPPVLPAGGAAGAPIRPGIIAAQLGCPEAELRFGRPQPPSAAFTDAHGWSDFLGASTAEAGAATYELLVARSPHIVDLDRTGTRLLMAALACHRADGSVGHGLAVFEPAGDGWRGISILQPEWDTLPGDYYTLDGWTPGPDLVEVSWALHPPPECDECDVEYVESMHRWTGTVLERVPEDEEEG
jgi:hypothetical protein